MQQGIRLEFETARFNASVHRFVAAMGGRADRVVFAVGTHVLAEIQTGWPVDTGASRAAWWGPRKIADAAYQLGNPMRYATTIEYGGYRGVGPKTHRFGPAVLTGGFGVNAGIYPRQRPAAPVRRALAKAYGAMTTHIQSALREQWRR